MFLRIPYSLSVTLVSFVGREMGKRCIPEAKRISIASIILYTLVVMILSGIVYTFRVTWTGLFTSKLILVKDNIFIKIFRELRNQTTDFRHITLYTMLYCCI